MTAAIYTILWVVLSVGLWAVVLRRNAAWWFLLWIGSGAFVLTLGIIADGRPINAEWLKETACIFLLLFCYWLHTYPPKNPEHIRYRVRH